MGMSSWILDNEEKFDDKVIDIVSESESLEEAVGNALKIAKIEVPHLSVEDVTDHVQEFFNEFWSHYL